MYSGGPRRVNSSVSASSTLDLSRICAAPNARFGRLAFEGQGAFAFRCRVPTARFIETVDVLKDGRFSLSAGFPGAAPDQFDLDRFEEGLDSSVIASIALAAHRRVDAMCCLRLAGRLRNARNPRGLTFIT